MDAAKLQSIHIPEGQRRRSHGAFWLIIIFVGAITATALFFARPWADDERASAPATQGAPAKSNETAPPLPEPKITGKAGDVAFTVSGYIINRERIELSPRTMNQVKWIGVKKGDHVKKDDVVVRLDDAEQQARIAELDGQLAVARVGVERAKLNFERVKRLRATQNETAEREDDARLAVASADAQVRQLEGTRAMAQVWLDWTIIKAPIDGVVLEKLTDPGELVTPQSFGGTRGPSTALLALADPNDLQVETDISESDLPKVFLNQRCRVSPEAYPDKVYAARVAEIAPEANRQKGTLQIKVQIEKPDHFLTPELSAKVEFLKGESAKQ
ncbi:MAG: efflux RND transporter periplasmic adaptor subunit [Chthoniobacteraceae bacterium]